MIAKYVVLLVRGQHIPLLWPSLGTLERTLEHRAVAEALCAEGGGVVVSAGSCIPADGWRCFGESLSLGIRTRGAVDTALMREHFALPTARAAAPTDTFPPLHERQPAP